MPSLGANVVVVVVATGVDFFFFVAVVVVVIFLAATDVGTELVVLVSSGARVVAGTVSGELVEFPPPIASPPTNAAGIKRATREKMNFLGMRSVT